MKKLFIIVLIAATSCEEVVKLDLKDSQPVYVIEGLITNQYGNHFVQVSRSVGFYSGEPSEPVNSARVTVNDRTDGQSFLFVETGEPGYYESTEPFEGMTGHEYALEVRVGDEVFMAEDVLYPVTDIDSLTYVINENEFAEPDKADYFYEMLFYAHEPQETEDFYLFKFYRNDSILRDAPNDIYFSNDDLLSEQINGIPTAGFYKAGDTGRVEMYSISNNGFIYYNDLINLLQSDGGMFGSPPVNPRTNISGGAMGFFQVSSVVSEAILIEE